MQIGDENVHLVRNILDEVFGSQNFHAQINFKSMSALGQTGIAKVYDYIIWYSKDAERMKYRPLFSPRLIDNDKEYRFIDHENRAFKKLTDEEFLRLENKASVFRRSKLTSSGFTQSCTYNFDFQGILCKPYGNKSWRTNNEGMEKLIAANRIFILSNSPYYKQYQSDFPYSQLENSWLDQPAAEARTYVVQTAEKYIQRCLLMTTDPGDLVFDPTCGSGTTACVAEQWGRRWITCDTSRVALALARTRLMSSKYLYYLLSDSSEGITKEAELTGKKLPEHVAQCDIKKGFVYKRVPHVTLKSIANNPDIKDGMTQQQMDATIARHADTETLYDQPYEDGKRVRVSGPFSVESLSPHRVLSTVDDHTVGTNTEQDGRKQQDFATMILDNLKKSGVQNTRKAERLNFNRLDPYAGVWLHAAGEYTDAENKNKRVAVSIGPEHGTVGPQQVKESAKEAVQGIGFDVLIICGFAFDPHVNEELKRYGKLTVLSVKMNPDLAMGDELLKKTGAGNLFMVFGEPDVEIKNQKNGSIIVEIKGVDVYDPTTGQIRSASTDDIACWFIDTNYNGESFFVHHAYFTGAEEPYEKLKRALRTEIDESAWSSLYSTASRPFAKPQSGKIAIKVINHYGDEVLKVFEI